jgi:putative tryptophan/tyrosine transport system substrate-binding protein
MNRKRTFLGGAYAPKLSRFRGEADMNRQANRLNRSKMTQLRHGRIKTFAAQKLCSVPSLKRDIVPFVAWTWPPREGHMATRIRRREFLVTLGGAAAAWPLAVRAQQAPMPVVGFLHYASPDTFAHVVEAFRQGLKEAGYIEGRNVAIEYRWAEGHYDRLPALAADLAQRQVTVITAGGNVAAQVAKKTTATIPIVFTSGADPVRSGLVANLSRPGANLTGASLVAAEMAVKRLELMRDLLPHARSVAMIINPNYPGAESEMVEVEAAGRLIGMQIQRVTASNERDIDAAFATIDQRRVDAVVVGVDGFFISRSERLATVALRHAIPAIFQAREFVAAGGLMSYAASLTDAYRQAGVYTGQVLKGAKPTDLPVVQPTKFELVINLKTAKAIGLTVPPSLLARADEVIE